MGGNDGTGRQIELSEYPGRLNKIQGALLVGLDLHHFARRYSAVLPTYTYISRCACGSETSAFGLAHAYGLRGNVSEDAGQGDLCQGYTK